MSLGQVAHYRLLARLGAGGMGEVFLAEDTRLNRKVAIKRVRIDTLDPSSRRRLTLEAQAVARLDHPNICGVHEVGEDERGPYIVMPFVEGETLAARLARGPLSIGDTLSITAQVTDALIAAHAQGVLHRDIKPANIMVTPRGQARVMDFGLAKFVHDDATSAAAETADPLTRMGTAIGTAAYMSPEQARGEAVDARTDLFSLGVVIYEMVTGRPLFGAPNLADTLTAILTVEPVALAQARPGTPAGLDRIVSKLLRKDREQRYQTAADLFVDVRAVLRPVADPSMSRAGQARRTPVVVAAGAVLVLAAVGAYAWWHSRTGVGPQAESQVARIESLAVLPLDNLSGDPSQEYLAEAMTEELTSQLSGIKSLRVISRTSSGQYKGTKLSMPEVAAQLHVDGLIEGSVVRDGNRVRITAQLIQGSSDRHVWSNAYDGDMGDMLALQRRVAEAIAREVRAAVTPEEQHLLRTSRPIDSKAMELYLKGGESNFVAMHSAPDVQRAAFELAITSFSEALKIHEWAEAYSGLSMARSGLATGFNVKAQFPLAREAALKAIALDDGVANGHGALGYVLFAYDWDLTTAEREYRRAIDLNPASDVVMGFAMVLEALGRFDEAKAMIDKAEERDPLSAVVKMEQVRGRLFARDYVEAIRLGSALPDTIGKGRRHSFVGRALMGQGRFADAIREFEQVGPGFGAPAAIVSAMGRAGRISEARTLLREIEKANNTDGVTLAGVYLSLGDRTHALDALERAYASKQLWFPLINVDPALDDLRGDTRFQDLLRRAGIPPRPLG